MKNPGILLLAFFLSGATALMYELVWIKVITTVYSSTSYVIALVLAFFMAGLGLGSGFAPRFVARTSRPLFWYAILELAIGTYGVLLLSLFGALPLIFARLLQIKNVVGYYLLEFFSIAVLLLLPTALMGATFPFIAKAYPRQAIGVRIGEVYAVNNLGAGVGVVAGGLLLIPSLGISYTVLAAAFLNILAGSLVLLKFYRSVKYSVITVLSIIAIYAMSGGYSLVGIYSKGVFGLFKKNIWGDKELVFYREGLHGFVSVWREGRPKLIYRLAINGQGSSSTRIGDMRVSTLLGYLPLLFKPDADRALVVGFGTGVSSGILAQHAATTTIEIEPQVIAAAQFFSGVHNNVLQNPRHEVIYDDARHFLMRSVKSYDIIVNHPLEPFQSFSSLLFTREFLELAASRLSQNGLYVQWLPVYDLTPEEFRDFYFTFRTVFPYHAAFVNTAAGETINHLLRDPAGNQVTQTDRFSHYGREVIFIGSKTPLPVIDGQFFLRSYATLANQDIVYLQSVSLSSPESLMRLFLFTEDHMKDFAANGRPITDNKPRLEFTTPFNRIQGVSGAANPVIEDILAHVRLRQAAILGWPLLQSENVLETLVSDR